MQSLSFAVSTLLALTVNAGEQCKFPSPAVGFTQ